MRRYWVPVEMIQASEVHLTGDVLHHIRDVCRMHRGRQFEVMAEGGHVHLVEVTHETKNLSVARILKTRTIQPLAPPYVHLALSIPRLPVFEAVVEKAVELGVKTVHPFFSEFSFFRTPTEVLKKKRPRWNKIIVGASQQSGRGDLMDVAEPNSLQELLTEFNRHPGNRGLFTYEGEGGKSLQMGVKEIREHDPKAIWLFVGSEGGFSEREVQVFRGHGLEPVTLGQQVLRVETACVATISIIKYDFDLMR